MIIFADGSDLLEYLAETSDPMIAADDRDMSRQNLARWMARHCQARDCDAVVVFDDQRPNEVLPPTEYFGRAVVINVPHGGNAFTEIAGPANRRAVEEKTLVVTGEPRLIEALRRGKATVQRPAEFMRSARKLMRVDDEDSAHEPDEKYTGLTDQEVDFWVEYFSDED